MNFHFNDRQIILSKTKKKITVCPFQENSPNEAYGPNIVGCVDATTNVIRVSLQTLTLSVILENFFGNSYRSISYLIDSFLLPKRCVREIIARFVIGDYGASSWPIKRRNRPSDRRSVGFCHSPMQISSLESE